MNFSLKRKLFSNRLQGIGNFGLKEVFYTGFKIIKLRGPATLFAYLKFLISPKKPKLTNRPFELACYITSRCNLRCAYCCFGLTKESYLRKKNDFQEILQCRDMTLRDFQLLVNRPFLKNCIALVLSGGEPLLNQDFFKIINCAKDFFPLIHLTTNGLLLGNFLEEILDSPLTHINISLDAINKEDYRQIRGGTEELFEKVVKNIIELARMKKTCDKRLQIILSFVVGKMNFRKMEEMIKLAIKIGVDSANFQNVCGFNCQALSNQTLSVENEEAVTYINGLKRKYNGIHIIYPKAYSRDKSVRGCRQCFDAITISADGDVGPCSVIVPKFNSEFGNIFKDKDVWNNKAYQELRAAFLNPTRPLASRFCEDCTFLNGDYF